MNKYLFKDGEEIKTYGRTEWVEYKGESLPDVSTPPWVKTNSMIEGSIENEVLHINDSSDGYCLYSRQNVVGQTETVKLKAKVKVLSSSNNFTLSDSPPLMIIRDGARGLLVALFPTKIQEYQSKLSYNVDLTSYKEIELVKKGTAGWDIFVDGVLALSGSAFTSASTNDISFNGGSSSGRGDSYWEYVHYSANDAQYRAMGMTEIGSGEISKELFDLHGMTDLSLITDEAIQQLQSNQVELLCWTDEVNESIERSVLVEGIPNGQLIGSGENIVSDELESILLTASKSEGANDMKVVVSNDNGLTWTGKNPVDINDFASVKENGFTPDELNALTKEELASLFPEGKARFAFYLEQENVSDVVEIQSLSVGEKVYTVSPTIEDISVIYDMMEGEKPKLYASRDDGVTWSEVSEDMVKSLTDQPEGSKIRVKIVLKDGQEAQAVAYSWA